MPIGPLSAASNLPHDLESAIICRMLQGSGCEPNCQRSMLHLKVYLRRRLRSIETSQLLTSTSATPALLPPWRAIQASRSVLRQPIRLTVSLIGGTCGAICSRNVVGDSDR